MDINRLGTVTEADQQRIEKDKKAFEVLAINMKRCMNDDVSLKHQRIAQNCNFAQRGCTP